ncbi:MAG: 30S ribosome-binding factor RbfA [Ignavibacteriales bacterium]|nr:30S ribosome-binding factor RbfA [Ignavibacteriales bacterium]
MSHRIAKVESFIKEEISNILLFHIHDPEIGFTTITGVKCSPDLKIAKVYISVLQKEKRAVTLERITDASGSIRKELASRITLRYVPELKFFLDESLDYVEKIDAIFKKINEHDKQNES